MDSLLKAFVHPAILVYHVGVSEDHSSTGPIVGLL